MKREIDRRPKIPKLDKQIVKLLSLLCFREDPLEECDMIFAFGTNVAPEILANKIEYLLNNKYSKRVIITGGISDYIDNNKSSIAESESIFQYIDKSTIPKNTEFLLEKQSKNTIENVFFADKMIDFSTIKSVICLSHSYASSRSVQTLKNIFSGKIISFPFNIPIDKQHSSYISRHNWQNTSLGRSLVWGEFLRLKTYGRRNDFPLTEEMETIINKIDRLIL